MLSWSKGTGKNYSSVREVCEIQAKNLKWRSWIMVFKCQVQFKCIFNNCVLSAEDATINKSQSVSLQNVQWKGQAHTFNKIWFSTVLEGWTGNFECSEEIHVTQFGGQKRTLNSTISRNLSHSTTHIRAKYIKMLSEALHVKVKKKKNGNSQNPSTEER